MSMSGILGRYRSSAARMTPSPARLARYQESLFRGVPLAGRSLLDVGGGSGVMSFYAAVRGARPVVCLDPARAGSDPAMDAQYRDFEAALGADVDVRRHRGGLADLRGSGERFDVVLIHNAVNHLDEAACAALPVPWAAETYTDLFGVVAQLLPPGGHLVVADCARRNAWGDVGLPNVFAPTIEWHIHQQPEVWRGLLLGCGFERPRLRWNPPSRLGAAGRWLLANRLGGYLTNSHFTLTVRRAA